MKKALVIAALILSTQVCADESGRQEKIARIVEAQGLHQMFQQQLDQSRASAGELGKDLYRKLLAESGIGEGQENEKLEQVFTKYLERCAAMFSARELVAMWASFYGRDLSDGDLDDILAYYRSPAGKKDVRASQTAMAGFSQAVNAETQKRLNGSIGQLIADLKSALAN